jgi:KDO2-lipid IV(A) lauroyltransferase
MAKKSKTVIWLEYAAARLLLDGLGLLPRKAAIAAGIGLARFTRLTRLGRREVALRNLEIAFPELSLEERTGLEQRSFENFGRVLGEMSQLRRITREQLQNLIEFEFETDESLNSDERRYYDQERAKGRGVILVSPHLGNWEIGPFAYSALREPLTYLARPLDNPKIEEMTAKLRSKFGNRPINKSNSVAAAFEILRDGGIIGVLPDVNVHPKDGIFVPFFGVMACTTRGVAMLAMRTNAMIIPMCTVWDETKRRYVVRYGSIIEPVNSGDRSSDIYKTTAATTFAMEEFIRAAPDQWIWIHKRWKTRPPGEKELY